MTGIGRFTIDTLLDSCKQISFHVESSKKAPHLNCIAYDPEICAFTESLSTGPTAAFGSELFGAAEKGDAEKTKSLLQQRVQPDWNGPKGRTPLLAACKGGHSACVSALLEHGAEPDQPNAQGVYPVHLAASAGHLDCLRALHASGADMRKHDGTGRSAADWAALNNQKEVVKLLAAWEVAAV